MVVGPVATAELRFLLDAREIEASTLVRKGEEGPWLAAQTVDELMQPTRCDVKMIDRSDHLSTEWHLSRQAHEKIGPMPWDVLKAMANEGKLQPTDLIWRPGMAYWVPGAAGLSGSWTGHVQQLLGQNREASTLCEARPA